MQKILWTSCGELDKFRLALLKKQIRYCYDNIPYIKGRSIMEFKYLISGCGIMGSAAAMHLAASSDGVALLGPDEDMGDRDACIPKGSYHDVGRITRGLDPDSLWGSVAKQSIERYRKLERKSGDVLGELGAALLSGAT
jgi:glycine/D-amino acid oxidase-like deaminating enzyme